MNVGKGNKSTDFILYKKIRLTWWIFESLSNVSTIVRMANLIHFNAGNRVMNKTPIFFGLHYFFWSPATLQFVRFILWALIMRSFLKHQNPDFKLVIKISLYFNLYGSPHCSRIPPIILIEAGLTILASGASWKICVLQFVEPRNKTVT